MMRLHLPSLYFIICTLLSVFRRELIQEIQKPSNREATTFSKASKCHAKLLFDHVV